ncbi:Krueppel-like factor 12, partial [Tyto alba]
QQSPNVHNYPDMEAVPLLLNNMKADPVEDSLSTDHFQTQTEPVDLSINKARSSPTAASSSPVSMTASASSPSSTSTSSSSSRPASSPTVITSVSSAASVPSVLTPGPLVASASGVGGQQFLHIIHPVPPSSPMNLQSNKMSHVHRIPVVVQSVPVVYTAVRSPGNMNNTIVVPLLEDGRSHVKAQMDPRGLSPRQIKSDSDDDDLPNVTLDSVNETGSTALSIARAVQE